MKHASERTTIPRQRHSVGSFRAGGDAVASENNLYLLKRHQAIYFRDIRTKMKAKAVSIAEKYCEGKIHGVLATLEVVIKYSTNEVKHIYIGVLCSFADPRPTVRPTQVV
ncbi:hypothetical protein V1478_018285 [Vespula squamosa]|uniref:Uncharacterized protein n=1 Tax=Vespula squamosa TaxID=30214 RepID=A0ABD1ZUL5_VESSQ